MSENGADKIRSWIAGMEELEGCLRDGEEGAADEVRRQASAISAGATDAGLPQLEGPADAVVLADDEGVAAAAESLRHAMMVQMASLSDGRNEVAVCGFDRERSEELRRSLQAEGLRCFVSSTPSEIASLSSAEKLVAVVLSLGDGHGTVRLAAEQLESGGTPILVVGSERMLHELDQSCLGASDGTMPSEAGAQGVVRWVLQRRYGARESIRSVRRDRVTGLLNRAALLEQIASTREVSRRTGEPITVAVVEVNASPTPLRDLTDKHYVDVLLRFSSACSRTFRETDVIARVGGGRFAVMFPAESPDGAEQALARLMDLLERDPLEVDGEPLSLAAKAGMAQMSVVMSPEAALDEAAAFLKEVKADAGSRIGRWSAGAAEGGRIVLLAPMKSSTAGILNRLLVQEGYDVVRAADGSGLPDLVIGDPIALAIVDEELGVEQADGLVQQLREQANAEHCPIILLGERGRDAGSRLEAFGTMGLVDYMSRPFTVGQFVKRTKQLLGGQVGIEDVDEDNCKLLLVDSHIGRLLLAANALHRTGAFEIILSRSPEDAIARSQQERPRAVFVVLDGGRTGNEMAQWLLQDGRLGKYRTVVAADDKNMRLADKVRFGGGAGVVMLPYDAQELPGKLAGLLEVDPAATRAGVKSLDAEIKRAMGAG